MANYVAYDGGSMVQNPTDRPCDYCNQVIRAGQMMWVDRPSIFPNRYTVHASCGVRNGLVGTKG